MCLKRGLAGGTCDCDQIRMSTSPLSLFKLRETVQSLSSRTTGSYHWPRLYAWPIDWTPLCSIRFGSME